MSRSLFVAHKYVMQGGIIRECVVKRHNSAARVTIQQFHALTYQGPAKDMAACKLAYLTVIKAFWLTRTMSIMDCSFRSPRLLSDCCSQVHNDSFLKWGCRERSPLPWSRGCPPQIHPFLRARNDERKKRQ